MLTMKKIISLLIAPKLKTEAPHEVRILTGAAIKGDQ